MNKYKCSDGSKVTQGQIDFRIREAKAKALEKQFDEHGYNFCEQCGRNSSNTRLDCSHEISVKKAKEEGKTEQCWNVGNLVIRCRQCHEEHDGLNIQSTIKQLRNENQSN